jgi:hypothetical protein
MLTAKHALPQGSISLRVRPRIPLIHSRPKALGLKAENKKNIPLPTPGVLKASIGVNDGKHKKLNPIRSKNVTKSRLHLFAEGRLYEPDLVQISPFCVNLRVFCTHRKTHCKRLI